MKLIQQQIKIEAEYSGYRLDQALSGLMPDYSRSKIREWIQQGFISLNRQSCKPKQRVYGGDLIDLDIPYVAKLADRPENIEFEILHQDQNLLVIN
ncbi:MAG: RNA pseudouridine synthase, partial [Proteobacteria bacterium]|nr:RNA pseudouridine synthase [Pseudomonadota bacterium]